jgi:uncharacterized protein (TIGR02246 family)
MNSESEQEVRVTFEATSKAWAEGDIEAFIAWYAPDATVILPGTSLFGSVAVGNGVAAAFAGPLKWSRRLHDLRDVRFLGLDTAVVVTRSETVFPGEDEAPADRRELATWVLTRHDTQWLVRSYHSCPAS